MKSHELCRELLRGSNPKELAAEMGLSLSLLYKWAQPPEEGSGAPNPLDRVEQLFRLTGDKRIAEWLCRIAGGYFVENPPGPHSKGASGRGRADHRLELSAASNETVEEFGEMLAQIATAAHDNTISVKEACEIRERWEKLKSTTEEFVRCCEEGKFAEVRGHAAFVSPHQSRGPS